MPTARLSVRAEVDIASLALDIAETSATRAAAFYDRLDEAVSLLTDFPSIGRARPELGDGVRSLLVDGRWSLVYAVNEDECVVLRVSRADIR